MKPCSAYSHLQSEMQESGPYFGKPVLSAWPLLMTVSGYFMGCDVHKLDHRVRWEPAIILPVFSPTPSECKCEIAMLLQEKSSWSKSTLFASIDSLTGFGNESPVRPRTPYLCVGMLGWGRVPASQHPTREEGEAGWWSVLPTLPRQIGGWHIDSIYWWKSVHLRGDDDL